MLVQYTVEGREDEKTSCSLEQDSSIAVSEDNVTQISLENESFSASSTFQILKVAPDSNVGVP